MLQKVLFKDAMSCLFSFSGGYDDIVLKKKQKQNIKIVVIKTIWGFVEVYHIYHVTMFTRFSVPSILIKGIM
jgi:hypothetical protein